MFDDIYQKYDLLNTVLSFGRDQVWRRRTIEGLPKGGLIADLCGGGGQLAGEILKQKDFDGYVLILDISLKMIRSSKRNKKSENFDKVLKVVCDVENLPFKENVFDGAVSGFGLRNLSDLDRFSKEIYRSLKSGACANMLELGHPNNRFLGTLYRFYFYRLTPLIARIFGAKIYAYKYLPASLKSFPSQRQIMAELSSGGWGEYSTVEMMGGISVIYRLKK